MGDPKRGPGPSRSSDRNVRNDRNDRRPQGDRRPAPARGPRPAAAARPNEPARPRWEDPNSYRSPGFQDAPKSAAKVEYDGLPKDEESVEGATAEAPRPASDQAPRGMGRRGGSDRVGNDANAYRGPGFREANQRSWARPPTAAERNAAIQAAGAAPVVSDETAESEDDSQAAMLARAETRRRR